MQNFAQISFANDLGDLATYYAAYERVMAHWRSVVKPDVMYELDYERLVKAPETTINEVLNFCGLEASTACVEFCGNTRPVYTASIWQVREPIYLGSVGRWRRYESYLGPLLPLMAERELGAGASCEGVPVVLSVSN
jgi:hypothetical protein